MRLIATRLLVSLVLCVSTYLVQATPSNTVIAVKTGIWTSPETWSCKCLPKRTDSIIIPQGIIVSVMQALMLGPSEHGEKLVISVGGVLNISSGSIHLDPTDRVIIMPNGKVSSKSNGGVIYSGIYAQHLEGGTIARGPSTLGDGFSSPMISDITAENDIDGVTVSWRSGTEIEVNYYYVLRSADGITFVPAGKVDGRGSLKQKLYTFIDNSHQLGHMYYRIDLTNTNGVSATAATVDLTVINLDYSIKSTSGKEHGNK